MKKVLLLIAVVAFAAGISSCKKDYTCTCDIGGVENSVTYRDVTKKEAEEACDAANNISLNGSCKLD